MSEVLGDDDVQGAIVHQCDGIQEADNRLPRWWLVAAGSCALFAALYWIYFHSLDIGRTPLQSYTDDKLALLDQVDGQGGPISEEELRKLASDPLMIMEGKAIFERHCAECHLARGQGKTGPNLTDAYWIYGGNAVDMYETILAGKTGKGMPAWGPSLGAGKVKQLVSFLLSIQGSNVPGKAPQGRKS